MSHIVPVTEPGLAWVLRQLAERHLARNAALVIHATGLRLSEFCHIQKQDFDAVGGVLRIRGKFSRKISLPADIHMFLGRCSQGRKQEQYLMASGAKPDRPAAARSIQHHFRFAGTTAESLRAGYIVKSLASGMDVRHLARLLGMHPGSVREYARYVNEIRIIGPAPLFFCAPARFDDSFRRYAYGEQKNIS